MPSSSRSRAATRRSPRPAPRDPTPAGDRPLAASLAAVFGLLVTAVDGYLLWLLWTPEVGWDSYLLVPVLFAVLAVAAAVAVFLGVRRGWLLLAVAAALPLLALLAVLVLFALLGGTLAPTGDTLDPTSLVVTGIGYLLTILVTSVVTAIGSVVQAASVGLVYVDRRMRLEGLDLELARSMDERASDPTGLDPFRTPSDAHDHAGASPR